MDFLLGEFAACFPKVVIEPNNQSVDKHYHLLLLSCTLRENNIKTYFTFMKHTSFIILLNILPMLSIGQIAAKNVYVELGGPGGFISANYDTRLVKSDKGLGARVGVGSIFDQTTFGFALPVSLNYLIGKNKNFLEIGAGTAYVHFKPNNQDSWFNFRKENFLIQYAWLGYRYQPSQQGFAFRAGLCQFFNDLNIPAILGVPSLYPSLSFGYSFK